MNISVVGLGKLGLPLACTIANKGHQVIGVDISPKALESLKQGKSHIDEPQVDRLLGQALSRRSFSVTSDFEEAIRNTDLTFIAVNTPDKADDTMDLSQIQESCDRIGSALKSKRNFHVIAISSTILPETLDRIAIPALGKNSLKTCGRDFGVCANPVFIALSTVVKDLLNPPVVVIGQSDSKSGAILHQFYDTFTENHAPIIHTTKVMAEFIKLAHNAYCTNKMAFINEMAAICSHIPGADIHALTQFFKAGGERQGRFLQAGLGFGGPCFPRDLRFFINYSGAKTSGISLLEAIDHSNREYPKKIVDLLEKELKASLNGKRITVLGLSYKPNSNITERSFSLRLIEALESEGAQIKAFDPKVKSIPAKDASVSFKICDSLNQALENSELALIATPWKEFEHLDSETLVEWMKEPVLFDPWHLVPPEKFRDTHARYIALGTPVFTSELGSSHLIAT